MCPVLCVPCSDTNTEMILSRDYDVIVTSASSSQIVIAPHNTHITRGRRGPPWLLKFCARREILIAWSRMLAPWRQLCPKFRAAIIVYFLVEILVYWLIETSFHPGQCLAGIWIRFTCRSIDVLVGVRVKCWFVVVVVTSFSLDLTLLVFQTLFQLRNMSV